MADVYTDPDRLRRPVRRVGEGDDATWVEIGWDEAFDLVADRLAAAIDRARPRRGGRLPRQPQRAQPRLADPRACAMVRALRTRNRFSATSVDQLPHQLVAHLMYGHQLLLPVPDIDRTSYFLVFGANPMASNGSLMTVPDFPQPAPRAQGARRPDGRARPAAHRDRQGRHRAPLRPARLRRVRAAGDAARAVRGGARPRRRRTSTALDRGRRAWSPTSPPSAPSAASGVPADDDPAARPRVRGRRRRRGVRPDRRVDAGFGSVCQWAIQLLNLLTGNLDREGGAMFTEPGDRRGRRRARRPRPPRRVAQPGARAARVRPASCRSRCCARRSRPPGDGQIRAMLTIAGNPVLSTPDGAAARRGRSPASTSWSRSTSTSTRPPGTPT